MGGFWTFISFLALLSVMNGTSMLLKASQRSVQRVLARARCCLVGPGVSGRFCRSAAVSTTCLFCRVLYVCFTLCACRARWVWVQSAQLDCSIPFFCCSLKTVYIPSQMTRKEKLMQPDNRWGDSISFHCCCHNTKELILLLRKMTAALSSPRSEEPSRDKSCL